MSTCSSSLHPLAAFVQAGGGGSFGGGGGGGGGGGWGGDWSGDWGGDGVTGDGDLIVWLFRFLVESPFISVPLLCLVAWIILKESGTSESRYGSRRALRRRRSRRMRASVASTNALREADPEFDERRFLARVAVAFRKAQEGWCAHDLEPLRPFVTWRVQPERDIPGLADYTRTDPGVSVQGLEDQASVAFWRMAAADRARSIEPLTRVGTTDFNERYAAELAARETYYADSAVGSVRTLGVLAGPERDRFVKEVVWDGCRTQLGMSKGTTRRHLHHTILVFARAAGARTRLDDAFTTMHCRTCGAHDQGGVEPACSYCGSPRTGDSSTWLLEDVLGQYDSETQSLRAELQTLGAE